MKIQTTTPSGPGSMPPSGERESASERVRRLIRTQILTAQLRPGEIVLEAELAQYYGLSKTPVREALQMLTVEGLVTVLPRKGYMVRTLGINDVREVMELRLILEPPLLASAALNTSNELVSELRALLGEQFNQELSLETRVHAAREFHLTCARASYNDRAATLVRILTDEINRLHHLMPMVEDHISSSTEQAAHEAILDSIARGDAGAAESLMREHLVESNAAMIAAFYGPGSLQ
ncbi:GntR family transcriptional regulator [Glutamicibacter ardleyensis]|uniref:GntR family transcriptional regulator n=1 Tax=Glutamicibacter ardleyensis TaxID=225894 RepID=UPI003FD0D022